MLRKAPHLPPPTMLTEVKTAQAPCRCTAHLSLSFFPLAHICLRQFLIFRLETTASFHFVMLDQGNMNLPPNLPSRGNTFVPHLVLCGVVFFSRLLQIHGGVIASGFILPGVQNNLVHHDSSFAMEKVHPYPFPTLNSAAVLGELFLTCLVVQRVATINTATCLSSPLCLTTSLQML